MAAPPPASAASPTVPPARRVGVLVNNVGGYSRGVIRGVASFATSRGWECRAQGVNFYDLPDDADAFDGLIVQAAEDELRRVASLTDAPVVNVSSAIDPGPTPSVVTDDLAVGRLGADHLLRRGHRDLVYFGPDPRQFALLRRDGFLARVADEPRATATAADDLGTLARLLRDRPQTSAGLGVMACNDRAGLAVLDLARSLGRRVPDELAVLGVDNDELAQSLATPPLSTINTARERIGFEAASLLERLLDDPAAVPPTPVLVGPRGVIARQSTDAAAVADEDVAAALRFIREHAGRRPVGVPEVVSATAVSRRQLERRFRQVIGRTVLAELRRERVDRARNLLAGTDLTLAQVADAAGFGSLTYFSTVFREQVGITPAEYRNRA